MRVLPTAILLSVRFLKAARIKHALFGHCGHFGVRFR